MGTSNWKDRDRTRKKKESQNDIKKLRRENEQLRREIWSLRDEYDKLEEILKKQKTREESGEPEDRSGDEAAGSGYSEDEDDQDEEDDDSGSEEEDDEDEEEQQERTEDDKKNSPEKVTTATVHRGRVNFDNLPVVSEEEELKKENKENCPQNHQQVASSASCFPFAFDRVDQQTLATTAPPTFGYQPDCPFVFPNTGLPLESYLMMTPQPQKSLGFDMVASGGHPNPPPPAGWQNTLPGENFVAPKLTTQAVVENDRKLASLADRRRAFFTQSTAFSLNLEANKPERLIDGEEGVTGDAPSCLIENRAKHFFAPLNTRLQPSAEENGLSDNGNSPGSEKTGSTVVSRHFKVPSDVCANGAVPLTIDKGDAKAFFSSENLHVDDGVKAGGSSTNSSNPLTRSVSCQDLNSRLSSTENLKSGHAKSDTTLDNVSVSSKPFKSQLNVVLRQPGSFRKSLSPDVPEIPQLPSIDYKLFSNPFLQNFEQAYQNFPIRTEGQSPVTHPLSIQVCESPVSATSYSSPVRMQPSFSGSCPPDADCTSCKRKDIDRLRLTIPNNETPKTEYQVTSFETPSPHTLQMPPMTPYELEALRRMPTGTSPLPRLYQNVPFVPRGAAVYCPGQGMRMYYDTAAMKVPAQTQTSPEDETPTAEQPAKQPEKRRSRKEKTRGSIKEKRASQRPLRKQNSVAKEPALVRDESRSSSTGRESSPKKGGGTDQTKRVSLYFSAKKRPSISSTRTSRSRSAERERTNSVSSREQSQQQIQPPAVVAAKSKARRNSTSSGSVPWCACWGNGCV